MRSKFRKAKQYGNGFVQIRVDSSRFVVLFPDRVLSAAHAEEYLSSG
jgi:hypothetical protein